MEVDLLISEAASLASQLDTQHRQGAPVAERTKLATELLIASGRLHAALVNESLAAQAA